MLVIVSDSSVLIDLVKARLIENAFALPYEFVVPDVMFADELLDLGTYTHKHLRKAGLQVGGMDSAGLVVTFEYAKRYLRLSNNDCFALALAKTGDNTLLTSDHALRRAAAEENVEVHGHLWLVDEMEHHGLVTPARLLEILEEWEADPLVWLPLVELQKRIGWLRKKLSGK